jgi:hypothetical protein
MMVGVVNLIAVAEMQVFTYVLKTYELALAQAEELGKGVSEIPVRTERTAVNGNRETIIKYRKHKQLLQVQEVEIAEAVLEVRL